MSERKARLALVIIGVMTIATLVMTAMAESRSAYRARLALEEYDRHCAEIHGMAIVDVFGKPLCLTSHPQSGKVYFGVLAWEWKR